MTALSGEVSTRLPTRRAIMLRFVAGCPPCRRGPAALSQCSMPDMLWCSRHESPGWGPKRKEHVMPRFTTSDGTSIFFKDLGPKDAQPIAFHHGWPLSADDWDA